MEFHIYKKIFDGREYGKNSIYSRSSSCSVIELEDSIPVYPYTFYRLSYEYGIH